MKRVILLSVLMLLIFLAHSFAEVPCKINYQGRLIENNVPVDGTVEMEFKIYDTQDVGTGTKLWGSGIVNVPVYNGLFRYVLGADGGDLSTINWAAGETLYLEVKVGDDILTPREPIYAYPYAINSHLLEGATKEYFLNTSGETQKKDGGLNIMGNVGIGTTGPGAKLSVSGGIIRAEGTSTPSTGAGLELAYDGSTWSDILSYDRGASAYKKLRLRGSEIHLGRSSTDYVLYISSMGNLGIGTTTPTATLDVDGTVSIFGSWTTKDILGNTLRTDTFYQVTTDGFVCVFNYCDSNKAYIAAYTASRMYTTEAERLADIVLTQGLPLGYSRYAAVTLPVRKGDYWRIAFAEGITPTLSAIRWLPIGSGTCVKQ